MPSRSSAEYWADRMAAHTWDTYNTAVDECRALQDVYSKAQRDIDAQLMQLLKKSQSDKLSLTDGYTIKRLKAIKANIQKTVDQLKEAEKQQLGEVLKEAYQTNYETLRAELTDRAFTTVNKKAVEKALKYPWSGADYSDRIWRDKASLTFALNEILTRGLVQGLGVGELARQIDGKMQSGYKNALRLARTETIHYLNDSALKAYKDSGVKKVQFWAAEDERTCPECGVLHGKEYPIDKVPVLPLHPNCRCTYIPIVDVDAIDDMLHIEGESGRAPEKVQELVKKEYNALTDIHRGIIDRTGVKVLIGTKKPSHYDRRDKVIYIREDADIGDVTHEMGHVIADELGLYHDPAFMDILKAGISEETMLSYPVERPVVGGGVVRVLDYPDSKFLSTYQGRVYETDYDGNASIDYEHMRVNYGVLREYFSEGFREYYQDPDRLHRKDPKLYTYIEEMKQRAE